jgi:hypothetical protein
MPLHAHLGMRALLGTLPDDVDVWIEAWAEIATWARMEAWT